ncbi:PEPxxWA-CTERM sorting domain-containing protein [Sphingomonas sp.]|uniref:PEPxxWA-CTERM sorting domain-containing protein n=1 Tax=Sphingomonas sp. TaxID=28214 RepID=UPI0038A83B46
MRKFMIALAGATALTAASAANAAITLGSTGQLSGSSTSVTSVITDNVNNPNKVTFTTNNAAAGVGTSFFDFLESYASLGVFSVTTATNPASTVTLFNVLTGQPVYATTVATQTGSSYSLNLSTNLAANTWYRFTYTANMATAGDLAGTANFYVATVPEPATWALMLLGFGGMGFALRRRRRPVLTQVA